LTDNEKEKIPEADTSVSITPEQQTRITSINMEIKQRRWLVYSFTFLFAVAGLFFYCIIVASQDEAIKKFAFDMSRLWLGALISLISSIGTYYFSQRQYT